MIRLAALATLATLGGWQDEPTQNSYLGKAPPELSGEKSDWLNSKDVLKLEKLKGRVVWLEFSFLG